jgi:hypothetical protein
MLRFVAVPSDRQAGSRGGLPAHQTGFHQSGSGRVSFSRFNLQLTTSKHSSNLSIPFFEYFNGVTLIEFLNTTFFQFSHSFVKFRSISSNYMDLSRSSCYFRRHRLNMDTQFRNYFMMMSKLGFRNDIFICNVFSGFHFIDYCVSLSMPKFLVLRLFTFELFGRNFCHLATVFLLHNEKNGNL